MARRTDRQANRAAEQASEAARVLQERSVQARTDPPAPAAPARQKRQEPEKQERVLDLTPRNDARAAAAKEIIDRQYTPEQGYGDDFAVSEDAPIPAPEPAAEPKLDAAPQQEPIPSAEPDTVTAAEPEAEPVKTIRVKVDGEEFDVPEDEVNEAGGVKAYRIQRAAENRLKAANEALAKANEMRAAVADIVAKTTPSAPAQKTNAEFIAERLDKIRFGDPEESAAALQEVIAHSNPAIDPNSVVEKAIYRIKHDQAVLAFDKEFSDVVKQPLLRTLVLALREQGIKEAEAQNRQLDWDTFYRTIGTQVRSLAAGQPQPQTGTAQSTSGTPSPATSDKEARKSSIVSLPAAAARAELPKEEKPETREDILNNARRKRGLPIG